MSLRVLILSRYDKLGASSRLRTLQYIPYLESSGMSVSVLPFFSDDYLKSLYLAENLFLTKISNWQAIVRAYFTRLYTIFTGKKFDIIWIEKEIFPYLPGIFEDLLAKAGIPYIVDYDDAIFHNYDLNRSSIIKKLLGNKLYPLLSSAYAVTAGNTYLAKYAINMGAKNVNIIPTVLDVERYRLVDEHNSSILRIGWIGSRSTTKYLGLVAKPLCTLAQTRKIVLVVIGAGKFDMPGVAIERHDWALETEAKLLESIHVGIMPLENSPWEQGKCGYKLIQYMACGKPVVASPVGANVEIVTDKVGMLADDDSMWVSALSRLVDQPILRNRMGHQGRMRVEQSYALQVTAPKIINLLKDGANC